MSHEREHRAGYEKGYEDGKQGKTSKCPDTGLDRNLNAFFFDGLQEYEDSYRKGHEDGKNKRK